MSSIFPQFFYYIYFFIIYRRNSFFHWTNKMTSLLLHWLKFVSCNVSHNTGSTNNFHIITRWVVMFHIAQELQIAFNVKHYNSPCHVKVICSSCVMWSIVTHPVIMWKLFVVPVLCETLQLTLSLCESYL
jgi:hypothetical protein